MNFTELSVRTELLNRLLECENKLPKIDCEIKKVHAELKENDRTRAKYINATSVEYDPDGNAMAIANLDGQERKFLMPLLKPDIDKSDKYVASFGAKLKKEGICVEDVEEWFEQENIVYYWLKNAVMPIAAGSVWAVKNWAEGSGKFYMVGDTPRHSITLLFESIPHLFPEFRYGEVAAYLHSQYMVLYGDRITLKNEIRRIKAQLKRLPATSESTPQELVSPAVGSDAPLQPARIDLKKTTTQQLKQQVLALLNLQNAREAAKWAKQQGLVVDLCYKAHWAIVLEKAQDVTAVA